MNQIATITAEIRNLIVQKITNGQPVVVEWLTCQIVASRAEIEGDDLGFYRVCAYAHVKDLVRRCLANWDGMSIPGLNRVQVAYTVERGGRTVLVPVDQLTNDEIAGRATEYERMAVGCRAHARELRDYALSRRVSA